MKHSLLVLIASLALTTPCLGETPKPAAAQTAASLESYRLGPGDEVRVTVFNEPDLKVEQKIGAQGELDMPLIGEVRVTGMTTAQLSKALTDKLSPDYLRDPNVSVTVLTYRPFYVIGEVSRPGAYPYSPNLTLGSAIATAGGFAPGASRGGVYLVRAGATSEEKVRVQDNASLQPGDTVRVGRSAMSSLKDFPLGLLGILP